MIDDQLQNLVDNYQPNLLVLQAISQVRLLATVGPSGTGKTVIAQALNRSESEIRLVVGETTRRPRYGERPDIDYLFRAEDEILSDLKSGELVDVIIGPNGDLYATRLSSFPPSGISVMALVPAGVRKFRKLPLKFFKAAFIVPDSFEHWQEWLKKQSEASQWTAEQIQGRLEEAKVSHEFALSDSEIAFVLNDTIDKAAKRLLQVAKGSQPDDQALARQTAEDNYQQLLKLLDKKPETE
ncbi:hypothetical protein HYW35_02755 [Candidatus Saccharibacteria bacterium]|nr:hypothetical protein [Candidatus Saccharibacteria bacterium]